MDTLNSILKSFYIPIIQDSVVVEILIIVAIALIINLVLIFVLKRLAHQATKTTFLYDDIFVKCLKKPVSWLIWTIGISFALEVMSKNQPNLIPYIPLVRSLSFIVLVSWFLLSFINGSEPAIIRKVKEKGEESIDQTTFLAISRLLKVSVLIIAGLMILQNLGMSISAVLAFGGVGGIAIGFASKDLLANFFGGLMIFLDKPFSIGDWIRSPDRSIEGTVEKINWRLTIIRTFDKRPMYIPNSIFNSIAIENPSRMTHRRIYETIGLRYQDISKIKRIVSEVEAMLKNHPDIDSDQTLMVNFNQFSESSIDFFIYTFTKTTNWEEFNQVKQKVLLAVSSIIETNGAQIAFPTQTLYLNKEQSEQNSA